MSPDRSGDEENKLIPGLRPPLEVQLDVLLDMYPILAVLVRPSLVYNYVLKMMMSMSSTRMRRTIVMVLPVVSCALMDSG